MPKRVKKPCKDCGKLPCECFANLSAAIMGAARNRISPPKRTYFECVTTSEILECCHCGGLIPALTPILLTMDNHVLCSFHCALGAQREGSNNECSNVS